MQIITENEHVGVYDFDKHIFTELSNEYNKDLNFYFTNNKKANGTGNFIWEQILCINDNKPEYHTFLYNSLNIEENENISIWFDK